MPANHRERTAKRGKPKLLDWMLIAVPLALALAFVPGWKNETLLFFVSAVSIVPLAAWLGRATEDLALWAGPGIGGLLEATMGNVPELILSLAALSKGLVVIVKASITGSIIGNLLLVLGSAVVAGGARLPHLRFNQTGARSAATSLCLAVIGLIIPTLFHVTTGWSQASGALLTEQSLSVAVAIVLLVTYILWLFFSLFTHKNLFEGEKTRQEGLTRRVKTPWPAGHAVAILAIAAVLIAVMSEFVSGTVETVCKSLHLSELFVGVIIVATIGNASEVPAVLFAMKNRMDLALGITIGSSLQVALFITPVLVLASYFLGSPMNLEFSLPEVAAVSIAVGVVALISGDGECNWIEGVQLIAVYAIIALLFYCLP